jgi:hypothetical protein
MPNDPKLSDRGGLAQPVRAKAARVGCMAAGAVKGSVVGGSAWSAAQAVTARSRSLQRLLGAFGEAFIWQVPNAGPIFLADILIDLDWDAPAIKPVAAVSLGT